ncbi:ribosome recycling factor [Candidatus Riflebacteria bacterium]
MSEIMENAREQMKATFEALQRELASVRTGKANPALLDKIKIDMYGTPTPLNHAATLACPDPRTITITPWDKKMLPVIEKAIRNSDLGLNPNNDGNFIRLNIPPLTEERRKEFVKQVKKIGENCKISIRNQRREINDLFKKMEKKSEISEDEYHKFLDRVQKLTDENIKLIGERVAQKEKELMSS